MCKGIEIILSQLQRTIVSAAATTRKTTIEQIISSEKSDPVGHWQLSPIFPAPDCASVSAVVVDTNLTRRLSYQLLHTSLAISHQPNQNLRNSALAAPSIVFPLNVFYTQIYTPLSVCSNIMDSFSFCCVFVCSLTLQLG